jgi:hypothetical protein
MSESLDVPVETPEEPSPIEQPPVNQIIPEGMDVPAKPPEPKVEPPVAPEDELKVATLKDVEVLPPDTTVVDAQDATETLGDTLTYVPGSVGSKTPDPHIVRDRGDGVKVNALGQIIV